MILPWCNRIYLGHLCGDTDYKPVDTVAVRLFVFSALGKFLGNITTLARFQPPLHHVLNLFSLFRHQPVLLDFVVPAEEGDFGTNNLIGGR